MEMETEYWHFIERHLPNYYSNDLVLRSDILWRYVKDDDVCDDDIEWIMAECKDKNGALAEVARIDTLLFCDAIKAYCNEYSLNIQEQSIVS